MKCWLKCCTDKDKAGSCIVSVPVWKGHSTLRPASPSIKVETTIVKAAKFFQSATWFSYDGVHIFCSTKMATADMSWGLGEKGKVGSGLVVLVFVSFFLKKKQQTPSPCHQKTTTNPQPKTNPKTQQQTHNLQLFPGPFFSGSSIQHIVL